MTAKQMWDAYIQINPEAAHEEYDVWAYGTTPDELAKLTIDGIKTATASAAALYPAAGESLPTAGEYSVILWSDGSAACVIRTVKVSIVPFLEVTADFAWKEGEGDRTLEYWRKVHKEFFTDALAQTACAFDENMDVVCEEFRVVFK